MSIIFAKSFKKQIKQVTHQPISKPTQKQDEQQMQPTRNKLMNAPKTNEA
jgi:hypothetical protein